jgi:cell division protein FtsL
MTAPRAYTHAGTAAGAFRPRPAPPPTHGAQPQPRPALSVVPGPAVLRRHRIVRLFTALAGLAACFGLFGVVCVHVLLAQGQGDLARLQAQVQEQEDAHQRLKLHVAELESPERIVAAARQQLGMTTPTTVVLLREASLDHPPAAAIP